MTDLPSCLARGERARLFPVLADNSKEGRTLSVFLACLQNVKEFGHSLLADVGQRPGARTRIETFTEVVLTKKDGDASLRPDGLILVTRGAKTWSALVEAKVGNNELTTAQVEGYLNLAKLNGIDALITISNQFAPLPSSHPVELSAAARRKAELYHWSWMYVLTMGSLLLSGEDVEDDDQRVLLRELGRFLAHPSAGVKSFDQMPQEWTQLVSSVQTGATVSANSSEAKQSVGAWHQEVRDLSLILSRQLGREVTIRLPRAQVTDPVARQKADLTRLCAERRLDASFTVPDAASPIDVCADLSKRSLTISMRLRAPEDRKTTKAKVNWLVRQLSSSKPDGIYIRLFWPGRAAATQHPLAVLRDDPDAAARETGGSSCTSFEVLLVRDLGARFGQRRNFIVDLEAAVPEFYLQVGEHLRAWQASAPRLREDKSHPSDVGADAIREQFEAEALSDDG